MSKAVHWIDKDVEIRYADTDQMGIVYHGVYASYCEVGRTWICRQVGLPYHLLEREGIFLMVADMYSRFKAPLRYGDAIVVRTAIGKLSRRLIEFQYEIRRKEDDLLAFTGSTKHVVTKGTDTSHAMPSDYLARFQAAKDGKPTAS